jgi:hypothetical protein
MAGQIPHTAVLLLLFLTGCQYMANRASDFGDCFRAEGVVGLTGGVWTHAGPLLHGGLGMGDFPFNKSFGWRYNYTPDESHGHDSYPNEVYGLWYHETTPAYQGPNHRCYVLLPPLLSVGGPPVNWLHAFDIDIGASFLVGVNVGFSPGEFLDFLLGWFGIDIAGDDVEERRKARSFYKDRADRDYPWEKRPDPEKP